MKLITLSGGLGNQMFQYAFYTALKKSGQRRIFLYKNKILKHREHCGYELQHLFHIEDNDKGMWLTRLLQTPVFGPFLKHLLFPRKIRERVQYNYDAYRRYAEAGTPDGIHLVGYWQSERYFEKAIREVRRVFTFDERMLTPATLACLQQMTNRQTVSIHVRRGDFFHPDFVKMFGGVCTVDYYTRAIKHIQKHVQHPCFYVFSDDLEWVRNHLSLPENTVWVDWNSGADSWQDMFLMSKCKHNILANSSFSWWGGWLNENPDKIVIAPALWARFIPTPDITPKHWTRL